MPGDRRFPDAWGIHRADVGPAGADVAVNYNQSAGAAADLCVELRGLGSRAESFHADVGDATQASRLVADVWERFGRIDVLVNNAGPYVDEPYLELDVADFDHIMETNVRATYIVTREAGARMKEMGSGCVVNIAATSPPSRAPIASMDWRRRAWCT